MNVTIQKLEIITVYTCARSMQENEPKVTVDKFIV
jgi:hypothetical protein